MLEDSLNPDTVEVRIDKREFVAVSDNRRVCGWINIRANQFDRTVPIEVIRTAAKCSSTDDKDARALALAFKMCKKFGAASGGDAIGSKKHLHDPRLYRIAMNVARHIRCALAKFECVLRKNAVVKIDEDRLTPDTSEALLGVFAFPVIAEEPIGGRLLLYQSRAAARAA